ncbi:kinase-like domain, phloem protein 2-like protein [Tanacetum coccineum]
MWIALPNLSVSGVQIISHGGDGGGDDRPPSHQIPTGCGGCLGNRGQSTENTNPFGVALERVGRAIPASHPNPRIKAINGKVATSRSGFEFGTDDTRKASGQVPPKQKAGSWLDWGNLFHSSFLMENSATREYPSLIHTFFLTHTVNGVFLNPEDKALYDEMLRLQGLGSNTETGVPYTEDEIMAIVTYGARTGHIPQCLLWKNGAWIFKSKGNGRGRGIKEKDLNGNKKNTSLGIGVSTNSEDTMNNDSPTGVASAVREGVTPSVVDMTVEMGKQNSLDDTTVPGSFPPLSMPVSTTAGNAPGKSSYANITSKPSGKKVNVRTLFTPGGNGIDEVVLVDSIRAIRERFANTTYGFFLGKKVAYPIVAKYVRNTWGKYGLVRSMFSSSSGLFSFQFSSMDGLDAMLENAFSEDGLSAIATKLGTPLMLDSYTSDMCMQSLGRSSYARLMVELKADVELKDNIVMAMPKITREGHYICNVRVEYEWKPPRCSSCKIFGHVHEECTMNTGAGEKKTMKKPSQTSRGVLVNNEATSSGSSFMNIDNDEECASNTHIGAKIDKVGRQIGEGKLRLLDNDENLLVPTGIVESNGEVELVFPKTANLRIPTSGKDGSDKGYGTNSLLEQWRDSYPDNDDYDPYDDDMYKNHDLSEHL